MIDAKIVGTRLRQIRQELGWSLADVERNSEGRFTAVVVGSYERGDRNISAVRYLELVALYGVSPSSLVDGLVDEVRPSTGHDTSVTLDLVRLREHAASTGSLDDVVRYTDVTATRRGDFNGARMTLRGGDLDTIASARGSSMTTLLSELAEAGIIDVS